MCCWSQAIVFLAVCGGAPPCCNHCSSMVSAHVLCRERQTFSSAASKHSWLSVMVSPFSSPKKSYDTLGAKAHQTVTFPESSSCCIALVGRASPQHLRLGRLVSPRGVWKCASSDHHKFVGNDRVAVHSSANQPQKPLRFLNIAGASF